MEDIMILIQRITLSAFLCGIIGLERDFRNKGAGLRTHILVGLGSSLMVLTSLYIFDIYKEDTIMDPTRMMTGIVTGIGFLCAGTIMQAESHVKGLTTAATLWIAACIGIAVGAGQLIAASVVTLVVLLVLTAVRSLEKQFSQRRKKS